MRVKQVKVKVWKVWKIHIPDTIRTNCHHYSDIFSVPGLLLMLNALSSSPYHLLIGGPSASLETRFITSIDVLFSYWGPIISGLENSLEETVEAAMGKWIDSLSMEWLKWVCSVSLHKVLVTAEKAVNPTFSRLNWAREWRPSVKIKHCCVKWVVRRTI